MGTSNSSLKPGFTLVHVIVGDVPYLANEIELLRRKSFKIVCFQMRFHTLPGKFTRLYTPGRYKRR